MTDGRGQAVAAAAAAAAGTSVAYLFLARRTNGRWWRRNYRGKRVTLAEGPALACGAAAGLGFVAVTAPAHRRQALALLAASSGAAIVGWYDDQHVSATSARGLRGHFAALTEGQLTSGVVKVGGLTGVGALALAVAGNAPRPPDVALIAACANLINLFDVRPGRAAKVAVASALPALAHADVAMSAMVGAALAVLPSELSERCMLGDTGANAFGALVGAHYAMCASRSLRRGVLALVVGLTVCSEFVSFSDVIARNKLLRRIDEIGRR